MKEAKYIILYGGKHPVRLVQNVAGKVFELVAEEEATRFDTTGEATLRAREHGIKAYFCLNMIWVTDAQQRIPTGS